MGRGRAKAKQTKVARQLKYGGPTTDLERLQAELAGSAASEADIEEEALEEDLYAKYVSDEDELEVGEDQDGEDSYRHDG
jgi:hypothetical protein